MNGLGDGYRETGQRRFVIRLSKRGGVKMGSQYKTVLRNVLAGGMALMLLAACGDETAFGTAGGTNQTGGTGTTGGGGADSGTQTETASISLQLVSAETGQPTQTITSAKPGRVIATVSGITSPQVVTFTTTAGEIPVPTAITNGANQAVVDILAGSSLGAGIVTASLSEDVTASLAFAVGATNLRMGSGIPFQEGVAQVGAAQISAGGTTVVSVTVVDENGNPFSEPVDVNFSSSCSSQATPTATLSSPVTTVNGVATSTYLAQGCVGDDAINVTANAGGINLSATATVNVLPADVGSIEVVSATPDKIAIRGAGGIGGAESSTVVFRVRDINGNPVNGRLVDFSLNTNVGGITLTPTQATTNTEGLVQTVVNSGTVATTVRVTASVNGSDPLILTQSSQLVISTGIPDQNSFSLSAETLNPEAWNTDGVEVKVTARLADHFNNPVPDGTAVSFFAEGGSIEPSCTTVNGKCSVTWTSQEPRPTGQTLGGARVPEVNNSMGQPYGGRVTILATAIGEESFPDLNGNGRFDASEMTAFLGNDVTGRPYDLAEAFNDYNEDGVYNPAQGGGEAAGDLEEFVDFNGNAAFDGKDGLYNGVLCSIPAHAGCSSTQKSTNVRARLVLVMSGSEAYLTLNEPASGTLTLVGESTGSVSVTIADLHGQPMPKGTTVKFTATVGSIVGPSSFTWANDNHNGGQQFSVVVKGVNTNGDVKNGSLIVEVTTPGGVTSVFTPVAITIQ